MKIVNRIENIGILGIQEGFVKGPNHMQTLNSSKSNHQRDDSGNSSQRMSQMDQMPWLH